MSEKKKIEFLENYYYNSVNPAAYTSPEKLYQALKSIKNFKFSKFFVSKWLKTQDAYASSPTLQNSKYSRQWLKFAVEYGSYGCSKLMVLDFC